MKTIEIKSIKGDLLFSHTKENATIKDAVEQALKECVSLRLADLSSANLRSADLSSADLRSANLRSADLRSANLSSANLISADLRSSDLRSANLSLANLFEADLRSADLRSANLRSADLRSANLISADLSLANLRSANLPIYCKWMVSIKYDKIVIGCKSKTIEDWDVFFASDEVYNTNRDTNDFKQIEAAYQAHKAYLNFLNKK